MKLLSEEFQEFLFLGIEPRVQMLYHWFVFPGQAWVFLGRDGESLISAFPYLGEVGSASRSYVCRPHSRVPSLRVLYQAWSPPMTVPACSCLQAPALHSCLPLSSSHGSGVRVCAVAQVALLISAATTLRYCNPRLCQTWLLWKVPYGKRPVEL